LSDFWGPLYNDEFTRREAVGVERFVINLLFGN
jgi:hypothetical protein